MPTVIGKTEPTLIDAVDTAPRDLGD